MTIHSESRACVFRCPFSTDVRVRCAHWCRIDEGSGMFDEGCSFDFLMWDVGGKMFDVLNDDDDDDERCIGLDQIWMLDAG